MPVKSRLVQIFFPFKISNPLSDNDIFVKLVEKLNYKIVHNLKIPNQLIYIDFDFEIEVLFFSSWESGLLRGVSHSNDAMMSYYGITIVKIGWPNKCYIIIGNL